VVGSNKVVAVSSEVLEVPTTKQKRVEQKSTRNTRSKVVVSTRIIRSRVVARSTRIKKSAYALEMIEWEPSRIYETL
jgi:hypothetical protein